MRKLPEGIRLTVEAYIVAPSGLEMKVGIGPLAFVPEVETDAQKFISALGVPALVKHFEGSRMMTDAEIVDYRKRQKEEAND